MKKKDRRIDFDLESFSLDSILSIVKERKKNHKKKDKNNKSQKEKEE